MAQKYDPVEVVRVARKLVRKHYGGTDLHPEQRSILRSLAKGRDVMGILPTGRGKSLIFQTFAKATNTMSLVITPLKALMRDQTMRAKQKGFKATYIASGDSVSDSAMDDIEEGALDLLYVSPERLRNEEFLKALRRTKVGLIAGDEAHCILEFGDRLRPAYKYIGEFIDNLARDRRERPPVLALTATATPADRVQIASALHLRDNYRSVVADPVRDNLDYKVIKADSCWGAIKSRMMQWRHADFPGRYIIYCGSRAGTEMVSTTLNSVAPVTRAYHAGLPEKDRKRIEEGFVSGAFKVIVATNAFGMGIDVPDIREVVHFGVPKSMEAYSQESGRAGRDGKPSLGVMLVDKKGITLQRQLINSSVPDDVTLETIWETLSERWEETDGEPYTTTMFELYDVLKPLLPSLTPFQVEPAVLTLDAMGALVYRNAESGSQIRADRSTLKPGLSKLKENTRKVAEAILSRIPGGSDTHTFWFDAVELARKTGLSSGFVRRAVGALDTEHDLISLQRQYNTAILTPKRQGEIATEVIDYSSRDAQQAKLLKRLDSVLEFADATDPKQYIRDYFGYKPPLTKQSSPNRM